MTRALAALLLLAACSSPPPPLPEREAPPAALLRPCPGGASAPPAPKPPRTVESIARYATGLDTALVRTEAARVRCAAQVESLQRWIQEPAP